MSVSKNGFTFTGSRTTGPSSHFLAVTFAKQQRAPEFVSVDGPGKTPDPEKVAAAKQALADLAARVPVADSFFPIKVGLTERDTASSFHYGAILEDILSAADQQLK